VPQIKMRVIHEFGRLGSDDESRIVMVIDFFPRGSGNRVRVERLGEAFKVHPVMGGHVVKVVCSSSRLKVYYRVSPGLLVAVWKCMRAVDDRKLEDELQGELFPGVA
jgi:hypothetical protein